MKIGVLGGGAAGFFSAITIAENYKEHDVVLIEKSGKVLAKVRVSGGGRCNVTHACFDDNILVQNYPRGGRELRSVFAQFSTKDIINWFDEKGVKLKTEADGRMFPTTDSSETIAQCLEDAARKAGVKILTNAGDVELTKKNAGFYIKTARLGDFEFDKIIIATGGATKKEHYNWLEELGHTIIPPMPSLFTFNLENHPLKDLPGISLPIVEVEVVGTKLKQQGAFLITHWGISGPAVLKLSAWGARELAALDYNFSVRINLLPNTKEEALREELNQFKNNNIHKQVSSINPFGFASRLWEWMCEYSEINLQTKWADVSKKSINKLIENILRLTLKVNGKSTFKEEFVTCGGVSLKDIDFKTMQSKKCEGLYFTGEVLDVDAVTGGFNFQAAWSTGYVAGMSGGA
ncbi:MAG: NAD(P)/FAD-dependent oxidoreductase [Bacteroidetes bacterium]|nr:NAD(P)/FAD-dependent oxidoreductase [Bacteroidota bacterium]